MGPAIRFYKMGKLIMTATVNGRLGYLDGDKSGGAGGGGDGGGKARTW